MVLLSWKTRMPIPSSGSASLIHRWPGVYLDAVNLELGFVAVILNFFLVFSG
jgi:hypothetical protein